jgi:hypothetical protein
MGQWQADDHTQAQRCNTRQQEKGLVSFFSRPLSEKINLQLFSEIYKPTHM